MNSSRLKLAGLWLLWLGALAAAGVYALQHVRVGSDLTAFLPRAGNETESLLLQELQNGAASRLMPIAVDASDADSAAALSKAMAQTLRKDERFSRIHNGRQVFDPAELEWIMAHRYLLSPQVDESRFSVPALREALGERLWELGSAAELAVKDLLARDPTHESLAALARWQPDRTPATHRGVWVQNEPAEDGRRALLMAQTVAPGFDLDAQAGAVQAVRDAYNAALGHTGLAPDQAGLTMTGPGPFGVELQQTTRREAQMFSTLAVLLLMVFLFWAYRSLYRVLLGALPLGTGLLLAVLLVNAGFGGLHGITLAFAVTLLGVAIDYPLHLFSHQAPGQPAAAAVRHIWPTLRLGVASTCIAYLTMVVSDFEGLSQLGWLTIIGLAAAALATRWGLPLLMDRAGGQRKEFDAASGWAAGWHARLTAMPRLPWWSLLLLVAALLLFLTTRGQLWQDDLGSLTPVPEAKQRQDQAMRRALAAPDLRYMLVLRGDDAEQVLQASERLAQALQSPLSEGWLDGFDYPARYLPSRATQRARQHALPDADTLRQNLQAARSGLPFKPDLFEPFIRQVQQARQQPLLTPADIGDSPLEAPVSALLAETEQGHWRGLMPLRNVTDEPALRTWFERQPADNGALFIDFKQASETMVAGFRDEMLGRIAVATVAILLVLLAGLRPRRRWVFVLLPVLAAVLGTASLLYVLGVKLSLFHMVSLMLVGGIVLDYALFFDRRESDGTEMVRTLHALSVCCVSTMTVFGILALSQIPVLRAIGATVACGVALGYLLAVLGRRRP